MNVPFGTPGGTGGNPPVLAFGSKPRPLTTRMSPAWTRVLPTGVTPSAVHLDVRPERRRGTGLRRRTPAATTSRPQPGHHHQCADSAADPRPTEFLSPMRAPNTRPTARAAPIGPGNRLRRSTGTLGSGMQQYALIAAGLLALVGCRALVRGGASIATRLGVSPLVGLTVVSIGTSLPELAVGIDAAVNDAGAMAIGNIAGTNIVNILLIPVCRRRSSHWRCSGAPAHRPAVHGGVQRSTAPRTVCGRNASRFDGALLLVFAIAYTGLAIRADLTSKLTGRASDSRRTGRPSPWWTAAAQPCGGIALVVIGADWLVDGAATWPTTRCQQGRHRPDRVGDRDIGTRTGHHPGVDGARQS